MFVLCADVQRADKLLCGVLNVQMSAAQDSKRPICHSKASDGKRRSRARSPVRAQATAANAVAGTEKAHGSSRSRSRSPVKMKTDANAVKAAADDIKAAKTEDRSVRTWTYAMFMAFIRLRNFNDAEETDASRQACIDYLQKHFPYVKPDDTILAFVTKIGNKAEDKLLKKADKLLLDNILVIKPAHREYDAHNPDTWHNLYTIRQSLEPMCKRQFFSYHERQHGCKSTENRLASSRIKPTDEWPCSCFTCCLV
jgi:hypothetical protein